MISSMLRYNFLVIELIALIFAIVAISTCSWERVILKDYDAIQAIYHSPLLTALTISDRVQIDYQNASGYELEIHSGLMDICAYLRRPGQQLFEPGRCKQTIARPSIGLAIVGVIFLVIGIVCTGFADGENFDERQTLLLSYCSAISVALGGLLLFTSHWTYSLSSELQLPTLYIRYGFSTYLIVAAAVLSLLSMSLVLWRLVCRTMVYFNPIEPSRINSARRRQRRKRRSRKFHRH